MLLLECGDNLVYAFLDRLFSGFAHDRSIFRRFVRIVNSGKAFDEPGARFGIETFDVTLLTHLNWRIDEDFEIASVAGNQVTVCLPVSFVRRNGRANRDATVFRDLTCDVSDPLDVRGAVLFRESEAFAEMGTHDVSIEQGNRPPRTLVEPYQECTGNRRLSRSRKHRNALRKALP